MHTTGIDSSRLTQRLACMALSMAGGQAMGHPLDLVLGLNVELYRSGARAQ